MEEHVGRGVFEQAKEVGGKRGAGEPIGLERVFEVFNEILTLAPLTIGVIEQRGSKLRERGHDKARILAVLTDFRFHDHVAGLRPALRRIGKGVEVLHGLLGGPKARAGFRSRPPPQTEQDGILRQPNDVGDPAQFSIQFLQHPQHARDGKRGIAAHDNLHVRKPLLEAPNNPAEHPHRAPRRMGIARAQHRTHQLPALPIKDQQGMIHVLIVVAVKAGELLLAVGGIVRGVNIQDDHLRRCVNDLTYCSSISRTERAQRPDVHRILQPRQRRLGRKASRLRGAIADTLEEWVMPQPIGIVAVRHTPRQSGRVAAAFARADHVFTFRGSRSSGSSAASRSLSPKRSSIWRSNSTPPSLEICGASKATVIGYGRMEIQRELCNTLCHRLAPLRRSKSLDSFGL